MGQIKKQTEKELRRIPCYRYGAAPECGYSYNTMSQQYESGISLASVAGIGEGWSFAVGGARTRRKYYYLADIIDDTGGDDELLGTNLRRISYQEYRIALRQPTTQIARRILLERRLDRLTRLTRLGYNIPAAKIENLQNELKN